MFAAVVEEVDETSPAIVDAGYQLSQADVDSLFTAITGQTTILWFSLLAQLILIGVLLVVVFVVALRRV